MELNILRADPAGNITVFVLDPVEKAQRAAIAEKIMAIPALKTMRRWCWICALRPLRL